MNTYVSALVGTALFLGGTSIPVAHAQTASDNSLTGEAGILIQPSSTLYVDESYGTGLATDSSLSTDITVHNESSTDISSSTTDNDLVPVISSDDHIEEMVLASTSVRLTYPVKAKFLGVIDATIPAQATVTTAGETTLRYPWYSFLYLKNQTELHTKLTAVARAADALDVETLTPNQQIMLSTLIHAALESSLDTRTTTAP